MCSGCVVCTFCFGVQLSLSGQLPSLTLCVCVCVCACACACQVELVRRDYVANGGWETFLSYEDPEQGEPIVVSYQGCL